MQYVRSNLSTNELCDTSFSIEIKKLNSLNQSLKKLIFKFLDIQRFIYEI